MAQRITDKEEEQQQQKKSDESFYLKDISWTDSLE